MDYRDRYRVVEMTSIDTELDIAEGLRQTRVKREVQSGPRFTPPPARCPWAGCDWQLPCPIHGPDGYAVHSL